MMKNFLIIFLILACAILLSACSQGGSMVDNDREIANARMDEILEAIKNKDKDELRLMFSKNAIANAENIDDDIQKLFDFFQGDFVSYDDWNGPTVEEETNERKRIKIFESTYDIETSHSKYRIAIKEFIKDEFDSNNVGIWSLYIIKMEDDTEEQIAYRGDGKYTPGINFNQKNKTLN